MKQLSPELIAEFQRIVREDYGRDLTMAEASEIASGLVGYFDLLAQMHHRDQNATQDANSSAP